jgi:hypothetical protein
MSQAVQNLSRLSFFFLICLVTMPLLSTGRKDREISEWMRILMLREWEAGAPGVAVEFGCHKTMWQLQGESVEQAIAVYAHDYVQGDCLILLPERGGGEYFFGYAGQFEGRITNDIPSRWPGVPVNYLRDTNTPVTLSAAKQPSEYGPNRVEQNER